MAFIHKKRIKSAIEFCLSCKRPEWACDKPTHCPYRKSFGSWEPPTFFQEQSGVKEQPDSFDITEMEKAANRVIEEMNLTHKPLSAGFEG